LLESIVENQRIVHHFVFLSARGKKNIPGVGQQGEEEENGKQQN
jgi:hypothetical protein